MLPACVACMVQVPAATNVTVAPDTVQTGVVCELKLTGRLELAVALTVKGGAPNGTSGSGPKVMVWLHCTSVIALDCNVPLLLAVSVAVLGYAPQLDCEVALVT